MLQPRALPWVEEPRDDPPWRGGIKQSASFVSCPFRAMRFGGDPWPRAMPWAAISRPVGAP